MNNTDEKKPLDNEPKTPDTDSDNGVQKTPEEAVKEPEPLTPVPAVDEINPPLEATLGSDDVATPTEKK